MNIFKKTYDENKKDFDEMGMQAFLEYISCNQVLTVAFLESIGMTQRHREFAEKFVKIAVTEIGRTKNDVP